MGINTNLTNISIEEIILSSLVENVKLFIATVFNFKLVKSSLKLEGK